ncbi:chemotaxis-specific protein-glutamate methyltransferase CheB [Lyngbya aestuarii]|uniref:chemotaxis-specific protein-glutamate methyltransferase CheB n=1 Tax=Lyngbya aestuarii TaxID=118322 RepID=UPI00403D73D3
MTAMCSGKSQTSERMRIAIVDDTLMVTEALRRVLQTVPDYELAWVARNGLQAVTKCAEDTPDLILMDLVMPVMDGVEATRRIMANSPCAILVVTASVSGRESKVFAAMGQGALDAVVTPIMHSDGSIQGGEDLLSKVATIGKLLGKSGSKKSQPPVTWPWDFSPKPNYHLVAIGASTGGPRALATILSGLDKSLPAAFVIIQHVDVKFAPGLVEWLDNQTSLPVQLASTGCVPKVGKVLVAGSNDHLVMQSNQKFAYTKNPRDYPYRPSVDVFFKSLSLHWQGRGVGVLLTGMGRDGAKGLALLQSTGWQTIAQDQKSCVVYGMPKAAVELGAAMEVLPVEEIATAIIKVLGR